MLNYIIELLNKILAKLEKIYCQLLEGTVQTVTGDGVNNTDPLNPIVTGNMEYVVVDMTSAEILAMPGTPKLLVPGQVGKVPIPFIGFFEYTFGTVAYAGGSNWNVKEETTLTSIVPNVCTGAIFNSPVSVKQQTGYSTAAVVRAAGNGLVLNSTVAFTTGDGTVRFHLWYKWLTL